MGPLFALVMGAALLVTAVGYRLVLRRPAPVFGAEFHLSAGRRIDPPLIAGSALFGIGWGIAGFCPGGAVPALGLFHPDAWLFVAAMVAGIMIRAGCAIGSAPPPRHDALAAG